MLPVPFRHFAHIRTGDRVTYTNTLDPKTEHVARVTGHGWKHSMRIVFLDDGGWCYRHLILNVERAPEHTSH